MRLQAKWDRKIARRGHVDIEGGADTNLISGSTFRRASEVDHGPAVILGLGHEADLTADAIGGRDSVFNAPRARAWALFSQAAHDLPTDRRTRRLLTAVAETGNWTGAARKVGMSEPTAEKMISKLCAAIGIERRWLFGRLFEGDDARQAAKNAKAVQPAPVRRLSKQEIRRLQYEPPSAERKAS